MPNLRKLTIVNVSMGTSTNEYSVTLPNGAMEVQIKAGDATSTIQLYTVSVGNGGTPANVWLINAGEVFKLPSKLNAQTLCMQSSGTPR